MSDIVPPSAGPVSEGASAPAVDGIAVPVPSKPISAPPPPFAKEKILAVQKKLLLLGGGVYAAYVLWSALLLVLLPDPNGDLQGLKSAGLMVCMAGGVLLVGVGWLAFQRISSADASIALRRRSLLLICAIIVPGLVLSGAVAFMISQEPPLPLDIAEPATAAEIVAPLSVTFSAQRATDILRKLGYRAIQYRWDTDGDGSLNEETVSPTSSALFERQGAYNVSVSITLSDQSVRRIVKRFVIPRAVFSVKPAQPVVERASSFSISHTLSDEKSLKEVQWDFGDGSTMESQTVPDTVHTYYAVGTYTVTAVVLLENQSQMTMTRNVTVTEPPPLPFAVTFFSEPANLVGPVPFGAIFRVETDEPVRDIDWNFGDGESERGVDVKRVGHAFEKAGVFPVTVRLRNGSGKVAELTNIVRATEVLNVSDLHFEGTPDMKGTSTIEGEVPLRVLLTPKTTTPLIKFTWEVPADGTLTVNGDTVQGTFRKEGTSMMTLLAEDPQGKAMRYPIRVEVGPPSAAPTISAKPESGVAPLTVVLDASQSFIPPGDTLAGFQWSFGDGNRGRGGGEEPGPARVEHTYTEPGEYSVNLRIVMASGKEYTAERTIIVRRPLLTACITPSRLSVKAGKGIEFDSSCSAGSPTSYLWDVRSDVQPDVVIAQSPKQSYVHVFQQPGTYSVSLLVKDQWNNQDQKSVAITVEPDDAPPVTPPPLSP